MSDKIRISYSSIDRFHETRYFKTLKGARKYARMRLGDTFDIGGVWGYAVSGDGVGKITASIDLYTLLEVSR